MLSVSVITKTKLHFEYDILIIHGPLRKTLVEEQMRAEIVLDSN